MLKDFYDKYKKIKFNKLFENYYNFVCKKVYENNV